MLSVGVEPIRLFRNQFPSLLNGLLKVLCDREESVLCELVTALFA